MQFGLHPSAELVKLFSQKPFQGQAPEKASIIFLSSDANYSPEITAHSFFRHIIEYHKDGVAFWNKYGVHHPFFLPDYPLHKGKGGRRFHQTFSKMGLDHYYANHISFMELLDVPTMGNKSKDFAAFFSLLSLEHLQKIDALISGGGKKLFLVAGGVLRDLYRIKRKYTVFQWLDYKTGQRYKYSHIINGNVVKEIYHFSSSQIYGQLNDIKKMIQNWVQYDC
jgi:hypothetical protein